MNREENEREAICSTHHPTSPALSTDTRKAMAILLPCCLATVGKPTIDNHPHLVLFWGKKWRIYHKPKATLCNEHFKHISNLFVFHNELSRIYYAVFLIIPLLKCYWFGEKNTNVFFSGLWIRMETSVSYFLVRGLAEHRLVYTKLQFLTRDMSDLSSCTVTLHMNSTLLLFPAK